MKTATFFWVYVPTTLSVMESQMDKNKEHHVNPKRYNRYTVEMTDN